jgi:hypothetical protein
VDSCCCDIMYMPMSGDRLALCKVMLCYSIHEGFGSPGKQVRVRPPQTIAHTRGVYAYKTLDFSSTRLYPKRQSQQKPGQYPNEHSQPSLAIEYC